MVNRVGQRNLMGVWLGGIVIAFGCADDTTSPGAPSPVPSPVAQGAMSSPVPLGPVAAVERNLGGRTPDLNADDDETGLKATAPVPLEPIDDVEIVDTQPTLVASNADGLFVEAHFDYEFVILRPNGGNETEIERGLGTPRDTNSTSYSVQAGLGLASSYTWRVRSVFDGANGPWSEDARFRTAAVKLGVPQPLSPLDGAEVSAIAAFRVRNGTVEGNAGTVSIELEVAEDSGLMDIVVMEKEDADPQGHTTIVPEGLKPETTYFWRVRAVSAGAAGNFESAWSDVLRFTTLAISLGAPEPLSPINGETTRTRRPSFTVRSGTVESYEGPVDIRIEVAEDSGFMDIAGSAQERARPRGETNLQLQGDLMADTQYFWRARALIPRDPDTRSDWSDTQRFSTPSESTTGGPAAPFGPGGHPANMVHVVQAVARQHPDALRNSCQSHGGSWRFMDLVVEALRARSGRWGYNCKRGNCNDISHDVVDFYRGSGTTIGEAQGSTDVAIIDIIAGHCGGNPQPAWIDQTQATAEAGAIGRWKYPR